MPRYDADWIAVMIGPERIAASPPEQLLDLAGVGPGSRVADVGCGPGFLTVPAARRAGKEGRVWALDTEPAMLRYVTDRAAEAGLPNIQPIQVQPDAPLPLADQAADAVLCSLVLHEFDAAGQPAFLRELRRILAASGRLLLVEWQPEPGSDRPDRIPPDALRSVLAQAGFTGDTPIPLGRMGKPGRPESLYAVVAQ